MFLGVREKVHLEQMGWMNGAIGTKWVNKVYKKVAKSSL